MKIHNRFLILALGLLPLQLLANTLASFGPLSAIRISDAMVCQHSNGSVRSIHMLDVYEANGRGIIVDLGGPTLSVDDKIEIALRRLDRLSPSRAKVYRDRVASFNAEALFLPNIRLSPASSAGSITTPVGCEVIGVGGQKTPVYVEDKRYVVDQDIWKELDSDHQAVMILGMVLQREFSDLAFSRYFNSYLFSDKLTQMTGEQYRSLLKSTHAEYQGLDVVFRAKIALDLFSLKIDASGNIESGNAVSFNGVDSVVSIGGSEVAVKGDIQFYPSGKPRNIKNLRCNRQTGSFPMAACIETLFGQIVELNSYQEIELYETGVPKSLAINRGKIKTQTSELMFSGSQWEKRVGFWPNGEVKSCNCEFSYIGAGQSFNGIGINFHENGALAYVKLRNPANFSFENGSIAASEIWFYETGELAKLSDRNLRDRVQLLVQNKKLWFRLDGGLELHQGGHLKRVRLDERAILKRVNGTLELFPAGTVLEFDPSGFITSATQQ